MSKKLNVYVIKDVVVGEYMNNVLTLMQNDQVAIRALKELGRSNNEMVDRAADIQLWRIGSFDSTTGVLADNVPELIGNLIDYVPVKTEVQ